MKKYDCEYEDGFKLNINRWRSSVEAANHHEAYKIFLDTVGIQNCRVWIRKGIFDGGEFDGGEFFDDHTEAAKQRIHKKGKAEGDQREFQKTKEVEQNENLSIDELLTKIILMQKQQSELFENQIKNQNEQTEALSKIRWAIIALLIFIVGQTLVLKMKLGL